METTLNKIREKSLCASRLVKLMSALGKTIADDEPISLRYIVESNGIVDALLCLRAVDGYDREKRLYAVFCANSVADRLTDARSKDAIAIAYKYANGLASRNDLAASASAAYAASAAASTASVAAYDAAYAAAYTAYAAYDAAYAAASAAAYDAAYSAYTAYTAASAYEVAYTNTRLAQKTEFLRMIDCIENGVKYDVDI